MKALIVCGGEGTRLKEKTSLPKSLIQIYDRPLLEWQILQCKKSNIKDVVLITGKDSDKIKDYFGNGNKFNINIEYWEETYPLGTAGFLNKNYDKLPEYFYYILGDIMFNYLLEDLLSENTTILIQTANHPNDSTLISYDFDFKVKKMYQKGEYDKYLKNDQLFGLNNFTGIMFFKKESYLKFTKEKIDLDKDVLDLYIKNNALYIKKNFNSYIKDMGTPERLEEVNKYVEINYEQFK